jgi:hypothetical protein
MRFLWNLAAVVSLVVVAWLASIGSAWALAGVVVAATAAASRRHWLRKVAGLGVLSLLPDGDWSVRSGDIATRASLAVAVPWPGAVFVKLSDSQGRYAAIITPGSAGAESFRRLLVRLREPSPAERV